jgi:hypothetical protein
MSTTTHNANNHTQCQQQHTTSTTHQMIRSQGLSSAFIIAIAYLHMSFINLIANLVQGSYTHVTIIPPTPTTMPSTSTSPSSASMVQSSPLNDHNLPDTPAATEATHQTDSNDAITTLGAESRDSREIETSRLGRNETNQPQPQPGELKREFETWLQTHFPHIEFDDYSALSSLAFSCIIRSLSLLF